MTFKTINGFVDAEIVANRQQALEQVLARTKPHAFPDKNLHCYRVIAPDSTDDFTAVLTTDLLTSQKVKVL